MRLHSIICLISVLSVLAPHCRLRAASESATQVNWESFLGRHDIVLNSVPESWDDGIYLGNGLLGAMIYKSSANELSWTVGRTDVTDNRKGPDPMFRRPRMPIGRMVLVPVGKIIDGSARLDVWNAEGQGTIRTDRGTIRWVSSVPSEDMAIVVSLETTGDEKNCRWIWRPDLAINPRKVYRKLPIAAGDLNPAPWLEESGNIRVSIQPLAPGGEYSTAWTDTTGPANLRTLYLSVGFTLDKPGARHEAIRSVEAARAKGVEQLRAAHRAWWHAYYPKAFLSIPDTRLESFYWLQMYKYASATRSDKPAFDLIGPWYLDTPWPGIWWDLNVQNAYLPLYGANRLELAESFLHLIDTNQQNLILNAPKEYQHDSSAIGISTSFDARDDMDSDPSSGISYAKPGYEILGNLVWACHNYWLHYRSTMDDQMLRDRLYPLLRRSVNLYLHLLKKGPDDRWHLPKAWSPEYPTWAEDTNYDLSLLRWGCDTLLRSAARLKIDDPLIPRWNDVLANLTPYPTGANGLMIGKDVPLASSHRHWSHILMVHPLHSMDTDLPENRDLVSRSLSHWVSFKAGLEGFSYAGAASLSSTLGRGEDALGFLNTLLDIYIEPNAMYREAGPVSDTPLAAANSVQELLLQSWGEKIRVFPAMPKAWTDAAFSDLRAEGAFLVSAVRRDGVTRFVKVQSLAGEPCRIKTDIAKPVAVSRGRPLQLKTLPDGVVELDLAKGETVVLYPEGGATEFVVQPIAAQTGRSNYYGTSALTERAKNPPFKRRTKPQ